MGSFEAIHKYSAAGTLWNAVAWRMNLIASHPICFFNMTQLSRTILSNDVLFDAGRGHTRSWR